MLCFNFPFIEAFSFSTTTLLTPSSSPPSKLASSSSASPWPVPQHPLGRGGAPPWRPCCCAHCCGPWCLSMQALPPQPWLGHHHRWPLLTLLHLWQPRGGLCHPQRCASHPSRAQQAHQHLCDDDATHHCRELIADRWTSSRISFSRTSPCTEKSKKG